VKIIKHQRLTAATHLVQECDIRPIESAEFIPYCQRLPGPICTDLCRFTVAATESPGGLSHMTQVEKRFAQVIPEGSGAGQDPLTGCFRCSAASAALELSSAFGRPMCWPRARRASRAAARRSRPSSNSSSAKLARTPATIRPVAFEVSMPSRRDLRTMSRSRSSRIVVSTSAALRPGQCPPPQSRHPAGRSPAAGQGREGRPCRSAGDGTSRWEYRLPCGAIAFRVCRRKRCRSGR
jgi:hypothetical protein